MTKEEQRSLWENRMGAYKASGQSVRAWCAENKVNVSQLYYWLKKDNATAEQPTWLAMEITEPSVESTMNVRVGGTTIEVKHGFDPELLLKIVRTLGALC